MGNTNARKYGSKSTSFSIIIPAKNEAASLAHLLPDLTSLYPDAEIIVINDGSTDNTEQVCKTHNVICISHPYSMGNGAAIKTGVRSAHSEILVTMDADGQHQPEDIKKLLDLFSTGYDMVIGARDKGAHANSPRLLANLIYNKLSSWITGHSIKDLTSGFRAIYARKFREYLYLLPNGFSYPTTITMAFFRSGYKVAYKPVTVLKREGKSHISPIKDGIKFLLIIFKVGSLYSPLKIFFPISLLFFFTGIGYYIYTYTMFGRFTNMTALLFILSITIFLIGIVSEQITALFYQRHDTDNTHSN